MNIDSTIWDYPNLATCIWIFKEYRGEYIGSFTNFCKTQKAIGLMNNIFIRLEYDLLEFACVHKVLGNIVGESSLMG